MAIFPTQNSMLSSQALADYIGATYGFGTLKGRLLLRGVSDTYVLEGVSGKYILKVYRNNHRTLSEIQAEVELLNILKNAHIPVSYPYYDLKGNQLQPFEAAEGLRYGVVSSYAEGEPAYTPTAEQIAVTGREMARLHNVTAGLQLATSRKPYNIETTLTRPLEILKPALAEMGLSEEYEYLLATGNRMVAYLSSLDSSRFSDGYCQYDFMPKNFHFDAHNRIAFFDFDFAGEGWLAHDLMSYWVHFALNTTLGRSTQDHSEKEFGIFLAAYQEIRPLSEEEIKAIPYLNFGFWIFYMAFHYEHFDDFSSQFWGPRWLKDRIGLIRKLIELHAP